MTSYRKLLLFFSVAIFFLITTNTYAWDHEISAGYGWGKEINEDYQTTAFVLSGKFYKFPKIDNTLFATIDGSISQLHADTSDYSNLTTAALALALRAYFINPELHKIRPYLEISSGPAYLSENQLGKRQQGANFDLQSTLGGGIEFGLKNKRSVDINLHLVHYCNAGLFKPNQGFNVPYVVSIGYQF